MSNQAIKRIYELQVKNDQAVRKLRTMNKSFSVINKSLVGMGTAIAGAFSISMFKDALEFADNIGKVADKVGLSTEALQKFRFAGEQTGVATNTMDMALQRFARRAAEADQGTGELVKTFEQLNISTRDSNGMLKTTEQLFLEYGNAIGKAATPAERLRLAFKGFDSEGAKLAVTFKNGADGVRALGQEAEEAGMIMEEEMVRKAEEINDRFNKWANTISVKVKGALVDVADAMDRMFTPNSVSSADFKATPIGALSREIEATQLEMENLKKAMDGMAAQGIAVPQAMKDRHDFVMNQLIPAEQKLADLKDPERIAQEAATAEANARREAKAAEDMAKAAEKAAKELAELKRRADSIAESVDPFRAFNTSITELDMLLEKGLLTWEHYAEAVLKAQDALDDVVNPVKEIADNVEESGNRMQGMIDGLVEDSINKMGDAFFQADQSFKDFANSFISEIARMILKVMVLQPLIDSLQKSLQSAGAGNLLSSFLPFAHGGAFNQLALPQGIYTKPTKFGYGSHLTPYARGGILGEAGAEAVLPLSRGANGKLGVESNGGGVIVNVNNQTNSSIDVNETDGDNGQKMIEVMVTNTVKKSMSNGSFDRVMGSVWGIRRR